LNRVDSTDGKSILAMIDCLPAVSLAGQWKIVWIRSGCWSCLVFRDGMSLSGGYTRMAVEYVIYRIISISYRIYSNQ